MASFKDFVSNSSQLQESDQSKNKSAESSLQDLNESDLAQLVLKQVKSSDLDKQLNKNKLYEKMGQYRKYIDTIKAFDLLLTIQELQMAMAAIDAGADQKNLDAEIKKNIKKVQMVLRDVPTKNLDKLGTTIEMVLNGLMLHDYKI